MHIINEIFIIDVNVYSRIMFLAPVCNCVKSIKSHSNVYNIALKNVNVNVNTIYMKINFEYTIDLLRCFYVYYFKK